MSALPPLHNYNNFNPTDKHIEEVAQWLRCRYPKHSDRRPLTWYYAYLVLEVSEITIREYMKRGILEDLTIPSLAEFIAKRDLVWDKYGRPEDSVSFDDEKIERLTAELNELRALNGKINIEEEEKLKRERNQLFIIDKPTQKEPTVETKQAKKTKKIISTDRKHSIKSVQQTFNFVTAVMQGDINE